ncbi:MAG TPA: class I SAM-dependent methyltransferase family protein [Chloroflexota bacterium]
MSEPDWSLWHRAYERPGGALGRRLAIVQRLIRGVLAERPDGDVRIVSMCAGQGRDLLPVLAEHPRGRRAAGRLVELDPANAAAARRLAREAGLDRIEVVAGDAALTDAYAGAAPADLVLACGIFGNVPDDDVRRTVAALPQLCARGATVIWTRHRLPPDLTPAVRGWLAAAGFVELAFESTDADPPGPWAFPVQAVGAHRWPRAPVPLEPGRRLFTFRT